ncbi:MAG: L,D-transpeptidase family protein [Paracoccus sp. (in: a-proteobacteria)]|uniref:L,D-transpeptidase family protein n=1 Tax=Paracoccus sp. TaxID=267 RepID=UPI0039E71EB1
MRLTPMGLRIGRRVIPCVVGRGGLSRDKREGDGATPIGRHRIVGLLYRPDRVARPSGWARPILPGDLWCDASGHPAYNHPVRAPFAASHEAMRRPDPLYDIVLVTDWNHPQAREGAGSAIFLHQWRRPGFPTAGCIGMARRDLSWLGSMVRPGDVLEVPDLVRWPGRRMAVRWGKD